MLATSIYYGHAALTIMEGALNLIGYLPKQVKIKEYSTSFRHQFGKWQMISGIALAAIGFLVDCLSKQAASMSKSFTWGQIIINFGLLHANHGIMHMGRGYLETHEGAPLLAVYDFYGRKFLPSLSPQFDFQTHLFESIKSQLDRIDFITVFPPRILIRYLPK